MSNNFNRAVVNLAEELAAYTWGVLKLNISLTKNGNAIENSQEGKVLAHAYKWKNMHKPVASESTYKNYESTNEMNGK